jgi:outer membrane protein OmpA-like peptidoglycan-associated protein
MSDDATPNGVAIRKELHMLQPILRWMTITTITILLTATALPLAADEDGEPKEAPGTRVSIEFAEGSAELGGEARTALDDIVAQMQENVHLRAQVIGHCAKSGQDEGEALSQARADAIQSYLIGNGIDASRIATVARGAQDATGEPSNDRRAEVVLSVG